MRLLLAVEQLRRAVPGGIGTYSKGLLSGLAQLGSSAPDVTLLASRPPARARAAADGRWSRGAGADPLDRLGFPVLSSSLPGVLMTRAWAAGALAAPRGFDLLHSVSLACPRSGREPLVATVHDLAWRDEPSAFPPQGRRWHEHALARALSRADAFVVPSERTARSLARAGADPAAIAVVAEGCDHLAPPDEAGAERLLSHLGAGGGYLLSVCTLEPRKNLDRLLAAYSLARESLPEPWVLVVVGPKGWGSPLQPTEGAVVAGQVSDAVLSALYARARCVAYVPLAEGFGLPAVEAMAAGAPVVASPLPSTGSAAVEVDPLDARSIAAGLVRASCDGADRSEAVAAGARRAQELTWRAAASGHLDVWETVLGRSRSLRLGAQSRGASPGTEPPARAGRGDPLRLGLDVSAVPRRPAGAGRYTMELVGALARQDAVSLTLFSRHEDARRWRELAPGAAVEPLAPSRRPLRLGWEQAVLPRILGRSGLDVHHAPHYTMPEAARVPKVVTVHDLTFFDHPEWHERSKTLLFKRAVRVACHRADAIVCVSETTAARLLDLLAPSARVHVIHHGVDHGRFNLTEPEAGSDAAMLAQLGVRPPYVAFVGTVEPRKDVPTLVRAFDRMCSAHPELTLVIAGMTGWRTTELERSLSSARHRERVARLGYVREEAVPALLRGAAAVAYPSVEEGFGLPALEALACGSPLVTTSGTAMAEVTGGAALLVASRDPEALAGALDMLVRRDQALDARRRRGIEVAAGFTWEASARAHVAAYREVSARKR